VFAMGKLFNESVMPCTSTAARQTKQADKTTAHHPKSH